MSYIVKTLILTAIFVAVIYFFMFRRTRKRRKKTFDSVQEYHDAYLKKIKPAPGSEKGRTNFVTRYNSSEDYREKQDVHDLY